MSVVAENKIAIMQEEKHLDHYVNGRRKNNTLEPLSGAKQKMTELAVM